MSKGPIPREPGGRPEKNFPEEPAGGKRQREQGESEMRSSGLQERQSLEGRGALKITPVLPQSTLFLATHADSAYRLPPSLPELLSRS